MNTIKLTTMICSLFLTFNPFAQGPPGGQGGRGGGQDRYQKEKPNASKIMELLDSNGDSKIDKDEVSQDRRGKNSEDFYEIDANSDGFIDLEDLEASLNNRKPKEISVEKILKELDDNEDGTLNQLEIAAKKKSSAPKRF